VEILRALFRAGAGGAGGKAKKATPTLINTITIAIIETVTRLVTTYFTSPRWIDV